MLAWMGGLEFLKMLVRSGSLKPRPCHPLIPYIMAKGRYEGSGLFSMAAGSLKCMMVPVLQIRSLGPVTLASISVLSTRMRNMRSYWTES